MALRKQLARLLQQFGFDQFESCKTDLDSLLKCIVSGFFSQAAKLGPDGSYTNVRNGEILAIHPDSVLFKSAPQWVVYHQVLETTSSFMSSILAIEPEWLTELAYWRLIQATLLYDEILNSRDHLGIAADVRVSLHLREPRITVNDFPIFLY